MEILESVRERLFNEIEQFSVELFPDDLEHYHLRDELGAILVQYAGSKFDSLDSVDIVQQRRVIQLAITLIARSQHDDTGAVVMLDRVRQALQGFKPTHCTAIHLLNEEFAGEADGLWQYQLMLQTETWQVSGTQPISTITPNLYSKQN